MSVFAGSKVPSWRTAAMQVGLSSAVSPHPGHYRPTFGSYGGLKRCTLSLTIILATRQIIPSDYYVYIYIYITYIYIYIHVFTFRSPKYRFCDFAPWNRQLSNCPACFQGRQQDDLENHLHGLSEVETSPWPMVPMWKSHPP